MSWLNEVLPEKKSCPECSDRMQDHMLHLAIPDLDKPFAGSVALCINSHNEGPDLLETVRSFASACACPLHVMIFADGTTDDSLDRIWRFYGTPKRIESAGAITADRLVGGTGHMGITIYHNTGAAVGCGQAKCFLLERCGADYILHSDGHNRMIQGTVDRLARIGMFLQCVTQPALGPLHCWPDAQHGEEKPAGNCYYGGTMAVENGMPNIHQSTLVPDRPLKRTQCVNNSCFGYPREVVERVGGFMRYPGRWGFQEAGFSIKCWFADVRIYAVRDVVVHHRYQDWWNGPEARAYCAERDMKRENAYTVPGWHRRANRRYLARTVFDAATWDAYWKDTFSRVDRDGDGLAEAALAASDIEAAHARFKTVKKRTDAEWFREVAKMPFDPTGAKVQDGATRGLYCVTGGFGNALLCVPAMKALAQLTGGPIDVWDRGLHVKAQRQWFAAQPWVRKVIEKDPAPDYREYRTIVGSYWSNPPISALAGCTIAPAVQAHRTRHEAECNMDAVRLAGFAGVTPSAHLVMPEIEWPGDVPRPEALPEGYVAICTEAAGRRDDVNKCWPNWETCCRMLRAARVPLVFLGNNEDVPAWMAEVGTCLVGKTTLMQAVEIISGARLFLGIDNGLSHAAVAVRTPCAVIYGSTSPRKNLQWGHVHVFSSDYACAPCFDTHRKNRCKAEPKGAMPCMRSLQGEDAARRVLRLLDMPCADVMPARQYFLSRKQMVENCKLEMFQQWDEITSLMEHLRPLAPSRVLVIGTHHAAWEIVLSAICARGVEMVGVDLEDFAQRREAEKALAFLGVRYRFVHGASNVPATVETVRQALTGPVDVLYIDGDHTYETVCADYTNYAPLVRPGGAIVFHDVQNHVNADAPGSRRHWAEVKAQGHLAVEIASGKNNGFGVLWTKRAEQPA